MKYEIQSRNDFETGSQLIIMIPEEDLDKKALRTIQKDKPGFIIPFTCRSIDGQIEFTYLLGSLQKMQYPDEALTAREYAEMWSYMLSPLLDCGDWFMRPYSFVLDTEFLFFNERKDAVLYMYVPSICNCSDRNSLREMAVDLTKHVTVEDVNLENKVLKSIMTDLNPTELLDTLNPYIKLSVPALIPKPSLNKNGAVSNRPEMPLSELIAASAEPQVIQQDTYEIIENGSDSPLDIVINIPFKRKKAKKAEERTGSRGVFSRSPAR